MSPIKNIHDRYFRASMSDLRIAREFFEVHIPERIRKHCCFDTLVLQSGTFVDEAFRESITDILYSLKIKGSEGYIYVLAEQQTKAERWMPFRLLKYMFCIMERHIEQLNNPDLPVIVPLVFFNGNQPYNQPVNIFELFGKHGALARDILFQPFHLIDLTTITDLELRGQKWSGIMQFVMKHVWARDFRQYFNEVLRRFKVIMTSPHDQFIINTLLYILEKTELPDVSKQKFHKMINQELTPEIGGKIMSLANKLREEGRVEGRLEGKAEGRLEGKAEGRLEGKKEGHKQEKWIIAKKMFEQGADVAFIAGVTGLSVEEVRKLDVLSQDR